MENLLLHNYCITLSVLNNNDFLSFFYNVILLFGICICYVGAWAGK